jgi:hypothetical protein
MVTLLPRLGKFLTKYAQNAQEEKVFYKCVAYFNLDPFPPRHFPKKCQNHCTPLAVRTVTVQYGWRDGIHSLTSS